MKSLYCRLKEWSKEFILLGIFLAVVWLNFYSFNLFPWVQLGGLKWWYLPHLLTLCAVDFVIGKITINWFQKNSSEEDKK